MWYRDLKSSAQSGMYESTDIQTTARDRVIDRILQSDATAKLPVSELSTELETFLEPVLAHLPEKRLQEIGKLIVQGIPGRPVA